MKTKRYSIISQIRESETKKLGCLCIVSVVVIVIALVKFYSEGEVSFLSTNEGDFEIGAELALYASVIYLGFTNKFWGVLAVVTTSVKATAYMIVILLGNSEGFIQLLLEYDWLRLLLSIDTLFYMLVYMVDRHRRMRAIAASDDPNVIAVHADLFLQPIAFVRWIVGSRLADMLQSKRVRRWIAVLTCLSIPITVFTFSILLFYANLADETAIETREQLIISLGLWGYYAIRTVLLLFPFIVLFLQMSLRPLIPLGLDPLDERQVQLIRFAHADGRIVCLCLLCLMAVLPFLGISVTLIGIIGVGAFYAAYLTPYIILAWNLPDGDGQYVEDEVVEYA